MEGLNETIIELFLSVNPLWRNIMIFALAFGEGLPVVGSFLPGGTIAILIGGLSQEGVINPWLAIHLIALGSTIGDMCGFFFGRSMLHLKWVRNMVHGEQHAKKWDLFDRHAALVIILGKILPIIRSTPALFAGARRMHVGRYLMYVIIASYLWAIGGIWGGNYLSSLLGHNLIILIIAIVVVSIIASLISFVRKKKKAQD